MFLTVELPSESVRPFSLDTVTEPAISVNDGALVRRSRGAIELRPICMHGVGDVSLQLHAWV